MFFGPVLKMVVKAVVAPSIRRAKIRAAMYYLQTVRSVREVFMVLGAVAFCFALMAGGAVLVPLALCMFMPWQPQTKAIVACGFGVFYLIAPLVVAIVLMSEKRWMRMTRADDLMKDVIGK